MCEEDYPHVEIWVNDEGNSLEMTEDNEEREAKETEDDVTSKTDDVVTDDVTEDGTSKAESDDTIAEDGLTSDAGKGEAVATPHETFEGGVGNDQAGEFPARRRRLASLLEFDARARDCLVVPDGFEGECEILPREVYEEAEELSANQFHYCVSSGKKGRKVDFVVRSRVMSKRIKIQKELLPAYLPWGQNGALSEADLNHFFPQPTIEALERTVRYTIVPVMEPKISGQGLADKKKRGGPGFLNWTSPKMAHLLRLQKSRYRLLLKAARLGGRNFVLR